MDTPSLGLDRFVIRPLWEDSFVCVMRAGHPSANKRWSLEAYLSYEHVVVSTGRPGPAQVDLALTRLGKRRTVATSLPSFLLVPELLARTDLIAMLPSRLLPARGIRLAQRPLPLELPKLPTFLAWHPRSVADPRHR